MVSHPSASSQPAERNGRRLAPLYFLSPPDCSCHLLHASCLGCKHWQMVCQHPSISKVTPAFTKRQPDAKYLSGLICSLRSQRQRQRGRPALLPSLKRAPVPLLCNQLPTNLFRMPNYYAFRCHFAQKIACANITQLPELFIFR